MWGISLCDVAKVLRGRKVVRIIVKVAIWCGIEGETSSGCQDLQGATTKVSLAFCFYCEPKHILKYDKLIFP